jgi:hypothetical protein
MPVPIDRTDAAFYAPLEDLRLGPETELYLGLVDAQDGVEGTRRRIQAARQYIQDFGIASECGISRGRDPNLALELHRDLRRSGRGALGPSTANSMRGATRSPRVNGRYTFAWWHRRTQR